MTENIQVTPQACNMLRQRYVALFFMMMQEIEQLNEQLKPELDLATIGDEDGLENEDGYVYHCDCCFQQTLYYRKPPRSYPFPLCLTDQCLTDIINKELNL